MRLFPLLCAVHFIGAAAPALGGPLPDRRRDQFAGEPGHILVPYAYNLPGIGWGYGVLGALTNVKGTHADVAGTFFLGDADGQALSVDQVHLLPRRLLLDTGVAHISRASLQSYSRRGMDSGKDEYTLAEFEDTWFGGARLTATSFERRLEAFAGWYAGRAQLRSLREPGGAVITPAENARRFESTTWILGGRVDLTDDYVDPRRGARLEPSVWRSPRRASGPDFYYVDWNLTAYLPVGRRSTWVFNFDRSDARVIAPGTTDPAALERETGLACDAVPDPARREQCRGYVSALAAANAYGTATMLGGFSRLRSYPSGRFKGAHSEFLGTELRWNVTDEVKPFDLYLIRDIRTAVQAALFYEMGSVADSRGELWRRWRRSAGAGLRVVTASGVVYRFDLAGGDEGWQPSVFFQYPWEL